MTDACHYEACRCTGAYESSFEMWDKRTVELVMLAVLRYEDNILTFQQLRADLPNELIDWFQTEAQRQLQSDGA